MWDLWAVRGFGVGVVIDPVSWTEEQLPTAVAAALNFPLSSDWWTVYWCSAAWFWVKLLISPLLASALPTSGPTHPHYHPVSLAITEFHCQLRSGQWPVCHYMVTGPGGGGGSQVWNYWPTCSNPCHCWLISGRITEFLQVGSVSVTHRIRISVDPWKTLNPTSVCNSNKLHQFLPIWMGSYPVPTWNGILFRVQKIQAGSYRQKWPIWTGSAFCMFCFSSGSISAQSGRVKTRLKT